MSLYRPISRRTLLRGLGTAVALPFLEAMTPPLAFGAPAKKSFPRRMAVLYVPNGKHMAAWTPDELGADFSLPPTLAPLKDLKNDFCVLSGLTADKARANGDGAGDHARAMSAFLTGRQPRKTHGADIRAGISADQLAAGQIGKQTRFASLEIGCDRGLNSGNCDSGYSCAYSANLSWRGESTPMAKEVNPRQVFERFFSTDAKGEAAAASARRRLYKKSILDFVAEDAASLKNKLGATDGRKLDEYLSGVREIEQRLTRAENARRADAPGGVAVPAGVPKDYQEHIRLLADMLVLAFQADLTRIGTFVFANDGSNRSYKFIGVPDGHHDLSHHRRVKEKQDKLQKINQFHVTQFAYLLNRLKAVPEGDGTLLDHCMIAYGSGISDGNRHNHDELPILLAGKGGGTIRSGRHIRYPKETPLTNLWLALMQRMGVKADSFGDSTGVLTELA